MAGPAQQDFDWGGLNVSQRFFLGGGGGGSGMLPLENLGFSYSQTPEGLSKIMLLKRRIYKRLLQFICAGLRAGVI